jgi:hypothetical protein
MQLSCPDKRSGTILPILVNGLQVSLIPVLVFRQKSNGLNATLVELSRSRVPPGGLSSSRSRETEGNSGVVKALTARKIVS